MHPRTLPILGLAMLLFALPALADRGAPIGIMFRDAPGDCITSDHELGPDNSMEYINNVESVIAEMTRTGSINVELKQGPPKNTDSRWIAFDFSYPAPGPSGDCSPPFTTGMPWVTDFTATVDVSGGFEGMSIGQVEPGAISFDLHPSYRFAHWWVDFNTALHPQSSNLTVTRVDATTWTIAAYPGDVAELMVPDLHAREMTTCGFYYMPFEMTVRKL